MRFAKLFLISMMGLAFSTSEADAQFRLFGVRNCRTCPSCVHCPATGPRCVQCPQVITTTATTTIQYQSPVCTPCYGGSWGGACCSSGMSFGGGYGYGGGTRYASGVDSISEIRALRQKVSALEQWTRIPVETTIPQPAAIIP